MGVDHKTVSSQRENLESIGEIPQCDRQTSDGRTYPRKREYQFIDNSPEGKKQTLAGAKEIRAEKAKNKRSERIEKIQQISQGNSELNIEKTYPLVYADPPWQYEHSVSQSRDIENQYPTMTLEQICDLPVSELSAQDAILFLWATSPKLEESMRVIESWGFMYRTCAVWDKQKIGMGYYFRQQHELLLVATKGSMPPQFAFIQ